MEFQFRTLTPLHVGDGSSLHSFDYVVHNGRFYRTSQRFFENFLNRLEENGIHLGDHFVEWAGDITEKMQRLEEERRRDPRSGKDFNQQLSDLRRQFSIFEFAKKNGQEKIFIEMLQQQKNPGLPINSTDRHIQEIRGFIRDGEERAYLPGSTIKGSIRTALLYHFLEEYAENSEVKKILQDNLDKIRRDKEETEKRKSRFNPERHRRQFAEEIEYLAFRGGMIPERGKDVKYNEAQDDLLKCLLVSDTHLPPDAIGIEKIDLYLVKKLPRGAGHESQRQRQAPAVEAVQPGQILTISLDINIEMLLTLLRATKDGDQGIKVGKEKHWIGLREKAKVVFGLTEDDFNSIPEKFKLTDAAILTIKKKVVRHILTCCEAFCNAQAAAFARWQKEEFCLPKHNPGSMAYELEKGSAHVLSARGVRLHFGFATGFEGITVVLNLLAHHKSIFTEVMEMFSIGDSPSSWKNRRPGQTYIANPDKFPKSHRLATRPGLIFPMGWLEWADDPRASSPATYSTRSTITAQPVPAPAPVTPVGPIYLKGTLKQGAELDAELVEAGNPGRFKLYIRENYLPVIEIRYAAGFKEADLGRIARVRVKNIKGKEEVTVVEFMRFR